MSRMHGDATAPALQPRSPFIPIPAQGRLIAVSAFGGFYLLVLVLALLQPSGAPATVVMALGLLIALRLLPLVLYRPSWGWLHPLVFTSLVSLFHLLRKVGAYTAGIDVHVGLPGHTRGQIMDLVAFEILLTALGVAAYFFGFFALPRPSVPRLRFKPARNLHRKVILAVAFSVAAFLAYMQTQGGLVSHVLSWGLSRRVSLGGEYYWMPFIRVGSMACLVWLAYEPAAVRRPLFYAAIGVSLPMLFFASGSRSIIVFTLVVVLLIWMLRKQRVSYLRTALLLVGALILVGALGQFRTATWQKRVDWSAITNVNAKENLQSVVSGELSRRVSDRSTVLAVLGRVPREVDHLYGESYLAMATIAVPRKLWANKPVIADARAGDVFFNLQAGMVLGPIGEAYWNFSFPGVIVLFALFGAFHGWLAAFYRRYSDQPAAVALYAYILWTFAHPTTLAFIGTMLGLVPLLALLWIFGLVRFAGRASAAPVAIRAPVPIRS